MRKCCEETLRVLRVHKESLLTIMEVFIHDPLYRWALTPANAQQRQVSSMGDPATTFPGKFPAFICHTATSSGIPMITGLMGMQTSPIHPVSQSMYSCIWRGAGGRSGQRRCPQGHLGKQYSR